MSSRPPKQLPWSLALGAAGFSAIVPLSASALTVGLATPFNNILSVSDTCTVGLLNTFCGNGATLAEPTTVASPGLTQFDPSQGVLTGTTLVLESTRTQTLQGGLTGSTAGATTNARGRSGGNLSAPGVSQSLGELTPIDGSATIPSGQTSTSFGPTSDAGTATNASLAVPGLDLDTYVGGGTVIANLTAPIFRANSNWSSPVATKGSSNSKYTLTWDGTLTAQYDYLLHAAPSFNSGSGLLELNLDFGTVFLDDVVSLPFQIFNLAGERVGLDLDAIDLAMGSSPKLTTNLSTFSDLGAGQGNSYSASFDTSELGVFGASYQLLLSDQDIGAGTSRSTFTGLTGLTLNLTGTVIARSTGTEIPELDAASGTGAMGLLAGALALVGENRRKRKKT